MGARDAFPIPLGSFINGGTETNGGVRATPPTEQKPQRTGVGELAME